VDLGDSGLNCIVYYENALQSQTTLWPLKYEKRPNIIRFEVPAVVKMWIVTFWVVTPYGLVDVHQRFGGTYRLHLQERRFF
jgi:hypothetical protein